MNNPNGPSTIERLLRRSEAARYITDTFGFSCSPKWLAKLACMSSEGPPFRHAGRVPLYARADLDAWAQKRMGPLIRSTSEVGHMPVDRARQYRRDAERLSRASRDRKRELKGGPRNLPLPELNIKTRDTRPARSPTRR
jgi:hypothetical protein